MPRPRFRSIDAPWLQDEEPDWKNMTKAEAVREASKLLGGERSPIKVVRYLEARGVDVKPPQAAKVIGDLHRPHEEIPVTDGLAHSVRAVIAIQNFAAEHGGLEVVAGKLADAERLLGFANEIGGLEVFRAILNQLQSAK